MGIVDDRSEETTDEFLWNVGDCVSFDSLFGYTIFGNGDVPWNVVPNDDDRKIPKWIWHITHIQFHSEFKNGGVGEMLLKSMRAQENRIFHSPMNWFDSFDLRTGGGA